MSLAVVQAVGNHTDTAASVSTAGITTTPGNLLVVACAWTHNSDITITDSKGNTWIPRTRKQHSELPSLSGQVFYAQNIAGGAGHTFTATPGGAAFITIGVVEVSGAATSGAYDRESTNQDSTGFSHTSGETAATTQDDEICVGMGAAVSSVTDFTSGGYTPQLNYAGSGTRLPFIMETEIVTAAGIQEYTFTADQSDYVVACLATFKAAGAALAIGGAFDQTIQRVRWGRWT